MSDLKDYIDKRKKNDREFASNYDVGYEEFKLGVILKKLRIQEGMTQEDLAEKMHTNCESHPFASSASFAVIRIKEKVNRKGREGREGKMRQLVKCGLTHAE